MTENQTVDRREDPADFRAFSEEEVSFDPRRFIRVLWSYRRVVLTAALVTLPFYIAIVLAAYLFQPTDRFAALQFEVRFDRAALGEYPNKLPFSEQDVLADPVLSAVYERNQLQRYGPLALFKGGLFVVQSSPERDMLDFEYRSKLADAKLSTVDRLRMEEEYHRKREGLKKIGYALNYHRQDGFPVPPTLEAKFLLDILSEWASQAVGRRGVLKYDVPLPSAAIQPSRLDTVEDAWLAVQALARKTTQLQRASARIMELPGASLARIGEFKMTVVDLRTAMDDMRRSRIVPLSRDLAGAPGVDRLLKEQIQAAIINRNASRERLKHLQIALSAYDQKAEPVSVGGPLVQGGGQNGAQSSGVTATAMSDSFLDKLVELSRRANNENYRQSLTEKLIDEGRTLTELDADAESLQGLLSSPRGASLSVEARDASIRHIEQELSASIKGLEEVYEDLSVKNLNPGTALYSVTGPVSTSAQRAFGVQRAALYGILTELIVVLLAGLACGIHALMTAKFDRAATV